MKEYKCGETTCECYDEAASENCTNALTFGVRNGVRNKPCFQAWYSQILEKENKKLKKKADMWDKLKTGLEAQLLQGSDLNFLIEGFLSRMNEIQEKVEKKGNNKEVENG